MAVQARGSANSQVHTWLASEDEEDSVAEVAVNALSIADSPRMTGADPDHVQALAASEAELPPIIVHHPTMRVIDGMHRVTVAKLRGQDKITARFFYGDEADAFVLAVKSNIAHGLPLSLADRKSAAERIVKSHPQWSDRMIAAASGLAARTIAEIRRRNQDIWPGGDGRLGQDGRVRPIDGVSGRLLASQLITSNPSLSLRQVAREVGISPETARDVRNRLRNGETPVSPRRAGSGLSRGPANHHKEKCEEDGGRQGRMGVGPGLARGPVADPAAIIEQLRADPALRFTENGRRLLRLLDFHLIEIEEWRRISENVPSHCSGIIAHLARECSRRWYEFAERLEQKVAGTC